MVISKGVGTTSTMISVTVGMMKVFFSDTYKCTNELISVNTSGNDLGVEIQVLLSSIIARETLLQTS